MTLALSAEHVSHGYAGKPVLEDVSLELPERETLAVVGESGAGKSTLSRILAGLERPRAGRVLVAGRPYRIKPGTASPVQMVFQHPREALAPHLSVGASITEPLRTTRRARRRAAAGRYMEMVGIDGRRQQDRPARFSGGQLQRLVLARALIASPKVLICDEPTSALDVSVQAEIVNLLLRLQAEQGFACLLVTHDLGIARVLADRILVLNQGRAAECTANADFFGGPADAYSRELLAATSKQALLGGT